MFDVEITLGHPAHEMGDTLPYNWDPAPNIYWKFINYRIGI